MRRPSPRPPPEALYRPPMRASHGTAVTSQDLAQSRLRSSDESCRSAAR